VADLKPLKLKSQLAHTKYPLSERLPFASVVVDVPAFHLESTLTYSIPSHLDEDLTVGSLVEVPYGATDVRGVVISRQQEAGVGGAIKQVTKLLCPIPLSNDKHMAFVRELAADFVCTPWDILSSAIATPVALGFKKFESQQQSTNGNFDSSANEILPEDLRQWLSSRERILGAIELPLSHPYWNSLVEITSHRAKLGSVLVVVPDDRDIRILENFFQVLGLEVNSLSSSMRKSERFQSFLNLQSGGAQVTIATRSAILAPLPERSSIIVLDDTDPSHYERKAPTWNTREVALLRSRDHSVIFVSVAPSFELLALAQAGQLPLYIFPKSSKFQVTFGQDLASSSMHQGIAKALKKGSVLIRTQSAGFVNSFSCHKCRNVALCGCGGKLYFTKDSRDPRCNICEKVVVDWQCGYCGEHRIRAGSLGVERLALDYARSFPYIPVLYSQADSTLDELPTTPHLVLSTTGVEPVGLYQAMALLDLETALDQPTLRASEITRLQTLRALSCLASNGTLFITLPTAHPFSQELARRSFHDGALREIAQRREARLPPITRVVVAIASELTPLINVLKALESEFELELIGPLKSASKSRVIVKVPRDRFPHLATRLAEVNRVLSLHKSDLITFHIDPYEI
jgi:primosomal protein N' (replication factor Y)